MITAIEIENFKGISTRQKIEFAPLTLIFGANSAGKSTIVHAMHFFREVLATGNGEVDEIQMTDCELRLGGFKNLIHKHDDENGRISIRVDVPTHSTDQFRRSIADLISLADLDSALDQEIFRKISTIGMEINVGKHFQDCRIDQRPEYPVIVKFKLFLDGQVFLETEATNLLDDEDNVGSVANMYFIDLEHPLLEMHGDRTVLQCVFEKSGLSVEKYDEENGDPPAPIEHTRGALPTHRSLTGQPSVWGLLERLMVDVIDHTSDILQKSCHLGPIREIPERGRRTSLKSNKRSWYRGQAAWQKLTEKDPDGSVMIEETEKNSDRRWWVLDLKHWIDAPFSLERIGVWTSHEGDWAGGYYREADQRDVEVILRDLRTDTPVSLSDVGVGISQFIPVLVAALDQSLPIAFIEQPELHLHPKQQAMLGDVFAAQTSRGARWYKPPDGKDSQERTIIVETHSELLILRLLRQVRETNLGMANSKGISLSPLDLKVYYVGSNEEGTVFKEIQISDTGKFVQPWPDDFFELDFHERFA